MARAQTTRLAELTAAVAAAKTGASDELPAGGATVEGDALLDALQAGLAWRPITLTSHCLSLGFGTPAAFELRATLAPGAPAAHAVTSVDLLACASAQDSTADSAPAHQLVRREFFAQLSRALQPSCAATRATAELGQLMRAAALPLGRLLDLVAEVQTLEETIPVGASVDESGGGVAISLGYSFFSARAKFVLHLLVTSLDPNVPLRWQLAVDDTSAAPPTAAGAAIVGVGEQAVRRKVGAIVDAHSRGFGRLRAIHAGLFAAFCPAA